MRSRDLLLDHVGATLGTILRGHPPTDEETSAAFDAEGRSRCRTGTRALCLVCAAFVTATAIIGYVTRAEQPFLLLQIRLAAVFALCLILWLLRTPYGHRYPQQLGLLSVVIMATLIETLAALVSVQATEQHGRQNLLILGASILLTWRPSWCAAGALIVLGIHRVGDSVVAGHTLADPDALRSFGLLTVSSIMAVGITVMRERNRWWDFCGRQSLARVQRDLLDRERRYRSLVETVGSAIGVLTPDCRIAEFNDELSRILGRRREDVLGQDGVDLFVPEKFRDRAVAEIRRVLAGESLKGLESAVMAHDGTKRILLWNLSCLRDSDGRPVGITAAGQDITERKQAEREVRKLNEELERRVLTRTVDLQESENRFRSVFESSPIGMMIADGEQFRVSRTNPPLQKLMGYSESELRSLSIADLFHPDDLERNRKAFADLRKGQGVSCRLENRYIRRDGSLVWSDTTVFVARDHEGKIHHVYAMVQDITDRKQKEALRKAEERAQALLARPPSLGEALEGLIEALEEHEPQTTCSIMVADQQGTRLVHAAAPRLPGTYNLAMDGLEIGPAAGSCGTSAYRRTPVFAEDVAVDPLWKDFRELASRHEIRACWSYPILSPSGRLLGTFAMHHGVPRRPTDGEVRLMEAAAHVAGTVIERRSTEELLRRHQIEMAHAGRVSLVGELAASLAHDLHQPLAAIANYASGCVRRIHTGTTEPGQLVHPIEQMNLLALRAGGIVRHLRKLIHKQEPQQERVDLNKVVRNAVTLVDPEAKQHGIKLRLNLADKIPIVEVDSVQIEQVVLNLLTNGIEAMTSNRTNGNQLVVRSSVGQDGAIELAVQDSGGGLSPWAMSKVFEPFYTTKPHGLGMGLPISRSIIEAHGGRMWATPNPDGGMTFQFRLPQSPVSAWNAEEGDTLPMCEGGDETSPS